MDIKVRIYTILFPIVVFIFPMLKGINAYKRSIISVQINPIKIIKLNGKKAKDLGLVMIIATSTLFFLLSLMIMLA